MRTDRIASVLLGLQSINLAAGLLMGLVPNPALVLLGFGVIAASIYGCVEFWKRDKRS